MGKVTKNRTYYAANAKRLRAKQRRYAAKHPTKIKKWKQEEYRRDPQRVIARHRKFKTGWTPEEYRMAFANQKGRCAICRVHQSKLKYQLNADHNHATNQKRGLLCRRCNWVLGHVDESVKILLKMADYLVYWRS